MAIRGKLVSQDTNDQPAKELLKQISQERSRLDAAATRKKAKETTSELTNSSCFELPTGWACAPLGDVVEIVRGITFPSSEKSKLPETGRVMCLRTSNVQDKIEWDDVLYIRSEFISRNDQFLIENDIVMSMANSRELVGKVALVDVPITKHTTFGGFLGVLRPISISPKFLMAFLRAPTVRLSLIDSASQTTNIANISLGKLRPLQLPIPPLAEQHRIVAKVDELMALCDRLESEQNDSAAAHEQLVETLLGTLTQSTDAVNFEANWKRIADHFDTLFTTESSIDALQRSILQLAVMGKLVPQDPNDEPASELLKRIAQERTRLEANGKCKKAKPLPPLEKKDQPYAVPDNWSWCRLGQSVIESGAGWSPACESRPREKDEWGVLKVSAVSWGVFNGGENKALPANLEPKPEHEVVAGDFLVSRANTAELVARSVVVEDCPQRLMLSDKIVRLKLSKSVIGRFINLANSCFHARSYYAAVAGGTSASMKNVSREQILNLALCLPPLAEQHRIVAKVDALMSVCESLKAKLAAAEREQSALAETLIKRALPA